MASRSADGASSAMLKYSESVLESAFERVCDFKLCPSHKMLLGRGELEWETVRRIWRENRRDCCPVDLLEKLRQECEKLSCQ
jgi:hypothetical protein